MISSGSFRQRKLIFEGNSLMNRMTGGATDGGHYIPTSLYNAVYPGKKLSFTSYAVSGQNQTQINAKITTNITPYVKTNDIIFLWEGTNDMYTNGLSGADAFTNLMTYVNTVKSYGCKIIVCTVIARDFVSDPADLMTRIGDYNTLMRANTASFNGMVDLAADAHFDQRADASNTTYYQTDKIHQAQAGQDLVISLATPYISGLL